MSYRLLQGVRVEDICNIDSPTQSSIDIFTNGQYLTPKQIAAIVIVNKQMLEGKIDN